MGLVKKKMGASFSEPSPRYSPYTAAVSGQVFLTGGRTKNFDEDKKKLLSSVHTFDVYEESWRERRVEGPAPPGLYWGACTSTPSGNTLQAYGGFDGSHNQGSLDQLDINSLNWTQLSTPDSSGPMKKTGCGMVAYNYKILLFGGKTGIIESTNELHIFDLQEGEAVHAIACSGPYPALKKVRGEGHHFVIYIKEVQVYNNEWVWFAYNKMDI